ncbi:MAG: hypothetical protein RLZZ450_4973 [Pseudomonadota bacterium]
MNRAVAKQATDLRSRAQGGASTRRLSPLVTGLAIFAIGFAASLAGDACHVTSGTTTYLWKGVPTLWQSGLWFPFLVGAAVLGAARSGIRAGLPKRSRRRLDVVTGIAAVLALYVLTATMRGQPVTVAVVLCGAAAVVIWAWWDPSLGALCIALAAAVLGPLAEIGVMAVGAARYASDSSSLGGVAPWLPCLYFAAGAVASGLWRVIACDDPALADPSAG